MTEPSLIHHTFSLERRYPASAAGVSAACRDPHAKRRWFADDKGEYALDFRVGGPEVVIGVGDNGKVLVFESRYLDIVEGKRIAYVFDVVGRRRAGHNVDHLRRISTRPRRLRPPADRIGCVPGRAGTAVLARARHRRLAGRARNRHAEHTSMIDRSNRSSPC